MIKECCVCGKREHQGHWRREFFAEVRGRISHGYCPACYEEFMDRLDQLLLARGRSGKQGVAVSVPR